MKLRPNPSGQTFFEAPQWYAIQTRYRAERKVKNRLGTKGVEIFLPVLEEIHRWSDRRKTLEIPLFSGYAFVRVALSPESRMGVLHTEGVIRFVAFGGDATSIPAKQIEDIQKLLANKVPCSIHPFLKVGRRVRIRGGCLDGLEGILEQSEGKHLVISIECIQRSVAVRIEGYDLELI
ncbi:MAG: UpxY family transcription antiterminator [Acidobacteriia bacterium]|nr:UpxY family transcription antiterminator [Terriglobia bacterium]